MSYKLLLNIYIFCNIYYINVFNGICEVMKENLMSEKEKNMDNVPFFKMIIAFVIWLFTTAFRIAKHAIEVFKLTGSASFAFAVARQDSAEVSAGRLIVLLIMAVVFVIVAVELLPTLFGQIAVATNNTTWVHNPYISPSLGLIKLIGLLFVVGIVVGMIALFLRERE